VLLLAQAGLGGVTVLTELPGHMVAAHMALAQALLACLILVAVVSFRIRQSGLAATDETQISTPAATLASEPAQAVPATAPPNRFPLLAFTAAIATYLLLLSGSYVTATPGALAACPQWPMCEGSFWPTTTLQTIHMLHRLVATIVGLLIIFTLFRGYREGRRRLLSGGTMLMVLSYLGIIVLLTQVFIGAAAVWTHFPVSLRAYHIGLATALWAIMVAVTLISPLREPDNQVVSRKGYAAPGTGAASNPQESV
jgi:protoheme IX farnesyltransferase